MIFQWWSSDYRNQHFLLALDLWGTFCKSDPHMFKRSCWLHNAETSCLLTSGQQRLHTSSITHWKLICSDCTLAHGKKPNLYLNVTWSSSTYSIMLACIYMFQCIYCKSLCTKASASQLNILPLLPHSLCSQTSHKKAMYNDEHTVNQTNGNPLKPNTLVLQ